MYSVFFEGKKCKNYFSDVVKYARPEKIIEIFSSLTRWDNFSGFL